MNEHRPIGTFRAFDPLANIQFVRGEGCYLWDSNGHRCLDGISGYSACNFGHCHPRLLRALSEQAATLSCIQGGQTPLRDTLETRLSDIYLKSCAKPVCWKPTQPPIAVWLSTTGARAMEIAWKIAASRRFGAAVRFDLGFHGRSIATSGISDTNRVVISGMEPRTLTIPFPRTTADASVDQCEECKRCLEVAERVFQDSTGPISCLFVEPAIGSRGYYFAPPEFFRRLVAIARKFEALVISDEIQMGLGRLGPLFVGCFDNWQPDLTVLGKSLGGGLVPISAVLGESSLLNRVPIGVESETFAANPLACNIAIEVVSMCEETLSQKKNCDRGNEFRNLLKAGLPSWCRLDGRGLTTTLDCSDLGPNAADNASKWVLELYQRGILVHLTGVERNRIAFLPPLTISDDELSHCAEQMISSAYTISTKNN